MATAKRVPQPRMVDRACLCCQKKFQARAADVARGWGVFCSKSCKANRQTRTSTTPATTGKAQWERDEDDHQAALDGMSDSDYGASDGGSCYGD